MGTPALDVPTPLEDAASPIRHPALGHSQMPACDCTPGDTGAPLCQPPSPPAGATPAATKPEMGRGMHFPASWDTTAPLNQIQGQAEGETGRESTFFLPLCSSSLVLDKKA